MRARPGALSMTALVLAAALLTGPDVASSGTAPAAAADPGDLGDRTVAEVPATGTPQVLDGRVYAVEQVGDTVVLGGTFTRVRDAGERAVLRRRGLVAFSASTGRIVRAFDARVVGEVRAVEAAADGRSVYVGGTFTRIADRPRPRLARVRLADGSVVGSFRPGRVAGKVRDLALRDGRLWVGGAFTHIGGRRQVALATLAPGTGRATSYMSLRVRGHHRRGVTQVLKLDLTPDGSQLVAVGNFARLQDRRASQLLVIDLGRARARPAGFRTRFFEARCSPAYDSYMRDVDISPDGRFFVVTTTGGPGGPRGPCDSASRFETRASGADVRPSWVDLTGGDTSYAVEVTRSAVYVGGHQRWWNNPTGRNRPGPGAVRREGIAALDPLNGLPVSWNPGRDRGVGVFDFLATDRGLWVVSDTTRIGGLRRARVALLPAAEPAVPVSRTATVPAEVYVAAPAGRDQLVRRHLTTTSATPPEAVISAPAGEVDWRTVRGAFMVDGSLHLAHRDGTFTRRAFDGSVLGPAREVATHDRLRRLASWRADVRAATAMAYQDGRIYFTRAGADRLFYRYYAPESGVVGARRLVASGPVRGFDPRRVRGLGITRQHLFVVGADGVLRRLAWRAGAAAARPAAGTARRVAGAGSGVADWRGRAFFLFQGPGGSSVPSESPSPTEPPAPPESPESPSPTEPPEPPAPTPALTRPGATGGPEVLLTFDGGTAPMGAELGAVDSRGAQPVEVRTVTAGGGRPSRADGTTGSGARLPGSVAGADLGADSEAEAAAAPVAAVVLWPTGDADRLSPGGARFTLGADFALDADSDGTPGDNGDNIVQRGLFDDAAQYKLQVDHRRVSCRVEGDRGDVVVASPVVVVPGRWYRASCARRGRVLTLRVGTVRADLGWARPQVSTARGPIGAVRFGREVPVAVGAKVLPDGTIVTAASDRFNGVLDNVVLERPRP